MIPLKDPAFAYRMYLPLAGVIALAVLGVLGWTARLRRPGPVRIAAGIFFLLLWSGLTWHGNGDYQSRLRMWRLTVQARPGHARARMNLGLEYLRAQEFTLAARHLDAALALDPDDAAAHLNRGILCVRDRRYQEAIDHFERAVRLRPGYAKAHANLGLARLDTGRPDLALRHLRRAWTLGLRDPRVAAAIQRARRMTDAGGGAGQVSRVPDDPEIGASGSDTAYPY